jgi:hypothetical protein
MYPQMINWNYSNFMSQEVAHTHTHTHKYESVVQILIKINVCMWVFLFGDVKE